MDDYEEARQNTFCQFVCDGDASLNKDKHQAFGMQFTDNQFRHNNVISSFFGNPITHKADVAAQLVHDLSNETLEMSFQNSFL